MNIIDCTYPLAENQPEWPTEKPTFQNQILATVKKDGWYGRKITMLEHYGTHIDAPAHFIQGGKCVDEIALEELQGPACVLDVRKSVSRNQDYALEPEVIEVWEKEHGRIPAGAIVLLNTGWSARWPDTDRYTNLQEDGLHIPGYGIKAAELLLKRRVVGIGIDCLSIDCGQAQDFPVHQLVLGAGVYQLENVANLDKLPPIGAQLTVAPLKLKQGSGAPCRIFAQVGNR